MQPIQINQFAVLQNVRMKNVEWVIYNLILQLI